MLIMYLYIYLLLNMLSSKKIFQISLKCPVFLSFFLQIFFVCFFVFFFFVVPILLQSTQQTLDRKIGKIVKFDCVWILQTRKFLFKINRFFASTLSLDWKAHCWKPYILHFIHIKFKICRTKITHSFPV